MSKPFVLTAEQEAILRAYYPTKKPLKPLAEQWGVAVSSICAAARRLGLEMRGKKKMPLTPERADELRAFWKSPKPLTVLSEKWNCSLATIYKKAQDLELPPRGATVPLSKSEKYMIAQADKRNVTVRRLESMLIRAIAKEELVDAVLDDLDDLVPTVKSEQVMQ